MKVETLEQIRDIINKEIDKMKRNTEAQRRFVAKKNKNKKKWCMLDSHRVKFSVAV